VVVANDTGLVSAGQRTQQVELVVVASDQLEANG
jgi:hypothetical protein